MKTTKKWFYGTTVTSEKLIAIQKRRAQRRLQRRGRRKFRNNSGNNKISLVFVSSVQLVSRAIGIVATQLGGRIRPECPGDDGPTASNEDLSRARALPLLSFGTAMSVPWIGAEEGRSGEASAGRTISAVVGSEGVWMLIRIGTLLGVYGGGDEGRDGRGVDGGVVRRNASGRSGRQMRSFQDDLELELCSSTKMNE